MEPRIHVLNRSQRLVQWAGFLLVLAVALVGLDRLGLFVGVPQTGIYGVFRSGGYTIQTVVEARTFPPLEAGQRILAVEGIPVSAWFQSLLRFAPGPGPSWSPDRPVSITVADQKGRSWTATLSLRSFATEGPLGAFLDLVSGLVYFFQRDVLFFSLSRSTPGPSPFPVAAGGGLECFESTPAATWPLN